MDECKLAYLAGHFDGEGSIGWYRSNGPQVSVSGSYKPTLELYKSMFGGGVYHQSSPRNGNKCCHQWNVSGRYKVAAFLLALDPYLREKSQQANVVLNVLRAFPHSNITGDLLKQVDETLRALKRM